VTDVEDEIVEPVPSDCVFQPTNVNPERVGDGNVPYVLAKVTFTVDGLIVPPV
jgi:hypothetical protein